MRLNPDCIRDILLYIEENTTDEHPIISVNDLKSKLQKYDSGTINYHIRQIDQANLVDSVTYFEDGPQIVSNLSWTGNEFLANIRGDNVWNHTKSIATKVGSCSLNMLSKISVGVLTQIINKQLGY
ncbi:DUF2513 domain-containing protein [Clostridium tyrobutyricum]|uniref:DUF2513 domain-containing protein n=1 Tax=Clostridium tyrobutyricum TaxID=1519 RepID=UPI00057E0DB1|nr:DUF2513 domain-containing protein [Clostridium tyrobutyricum]